MATVHIACVLERLRQGFIVRVHDDGGPGLYFADIGDHLNRSKDMIYVTLVCYSATVFSTANDF